MLAAIRWTHFCNNAMENRHGLVVDTELTHATGWAERAAAAAFALAPLPAPC